MNMPVITKKVDIRRSFAEEKPIVAPSGVGTRCRGLRPPFSHPCALWLFVWRCPRPSRRPHDPLWDFDVTNLMFVDGVILMDEFAVD